MINKEDLLDKYFEKSLEENEKQQFEDLLVSDVAFKNEFEFQKKLKAAISLNERQKQKDFLLNLESEINKESNFNIKKWLSIAASFLIFITIGYFLFLQNPNEEKLFAKYYQPFPNIEKPITRGSVQEDIASQAFFAYDTENYKKAITLFDAIYQQDRLDYALFYKGLSYMELKQYEEAIKTFESFNFNEKSNFYSNFSWYLALSYIKTKQTAKAIPYLEKVTENDNSFQTMAKELLKEIK